MNGDNERTTSIAPRLDAPITQQPRGEPDADLHRAALGRVGAGSSVAIPADAAERSRLIAEIHQLRSMLLNESMKGALEGVGANLGVSLLRALFLMLKR